MKIFKTKAEFSQWRKTLLNKSIGFVPTMGALHAGHLSLIHASKKECQKTIVSIFVNKLQFGPNEDFNTYPRFIDNDIKLLTNEKVDALFCPEGEEMYPTDLSFEINETKIANELEGNARPNFFSGVCLIVLKLFNIVQPDYAYFGEKDFQQLFIIQKMIKDFNLPIKLKSCPTVREKNGLAMSSRNKYLSSTEKEEATILYQTLKKGAEFCLNKSEYTRQVMKYNHEQTISFLKQDMKRWVEEKGKVDQEVRSNRICYIDIRDLHTFKKTKMLQGQKIIIVGAMYYKKIRLIDNIIVDINWA